MQNLTLGFARLNIFTDYLNRSEIIDYKFAIYIILGEKEKPVFFHRIERTFSPNKQFYIIHGHKGICLALQGIYQGVVW